jgi:Fur family transcriptional regulator, ferric uptake regulator
MPAPTTPRRRRNTAKQQVVLEVLRGSDKFRSAQQLYLQIRHERPLRIGLTSIYRILRGLTDDRIAETQRAEDGEILYRLRDSPEHRHYLLCRRCGRAVGFTPTALEDHTADLIRRHRYTEVTHRFDLYGICPLCKAAIAHAGAGSDEAAHRPERM